MSVVVLWSVVSVPDHEHFISGAIIPSNSGAPQLSRLYSVLAVLIG